MKEKHPFRKDTPERMAGIYNRAESEIVALLQEEKQAHKIFRKKMNNIRLALVAARTREVGRGWGSTGGVKT